MMIEKKMICLQTLLQAVKIAFQYLVQVLCFDYNKTDIKHYPTKGYRFINESVLYKSVNTKDYFYSGSDFRIIINL